MAKKIDINDGPLWVVVQKWKDAKGWGLWPDTISYSAEAARAKFINIYALAVDWKGAYKKGYRCIKVKVVPDAEAT